MIKCQNDSLAYTENNGRERPDTQRHCAEDEYQREKYI